MQFFQFLSSTKNLPSYKQNNKISDTEMAIFYGFWLPKSRSRALESPN